MPTKVYLICGKICSGKSFYVNKLKNEAGAVVLSCQVNFPDSAGFKKANNTICITNR